MISFFKIGSNSGSKDSDTFSIRTGPPNRIDCSRVRNSKGSSTLHIFNDGPLVNKIKIIIIFD